MLSVRSGAEPPPVSLREALGQRHDPDSQHPAAVQLEPTVEGGELRHLQLHPATLSYRTWCPIAEARADVVTETRSNSVREATSSRSLSKSLTEPFVVWPILSSRRLQAHNSGRTVICTPPEW